MFHVCSVRCLSALLGVVTVVGSPLYGESLLPNRFGIQLEVEEQTEYSAVLGGDYTRYVFSNGWVPASPTADYAVSDYTDYWSTTDAAIADNTQIAGGEPYDVEAVYFDDDRQNLYISIVTSFPSPVPNGGYLEGRVDDILVVTGDIALDLGLNGPASAVDPFHYDYGVNVNNEVRPASSGQNATANASPAIGGTIFRTANSDWYTGTDRNDIDTPRDELTNFDPEWDSFLGEVEGDATVTYDHVAFDGAVLENNAETYVLEAVIPRSALPVLSPGDTVGVQYVMGCRNDAGSASYVLRVEGVINYIPEPSVAILLGLGLCCSVRRRHRDRPSSRRRRDITQAQC